MCMVWALNVNVQYKCDKSHAGVTTAFWKSGNIRKYVNVCKTWRNLMRSGLELHFPHRGAKTMGLLKWQHAAATLHLVVCLSSASLHQSTRHVAEAQIRQTQAVGEEGDEKRTCHPQRQQPYSWAPARTELLAFAHDGQLSAPDWS